MSFNINKHIKDHAYFYKEFDTHKNNDLHFKFSILDLYFYANNYNVEEKLEEILKDLLQPVTYTIQMKNGFYIDKNGNKKQKYANRNITINLQDYLTALAIHMEGSKGEYTQPHIHFLIKKNARLGLNYSLLKYHISKTLEKHGLIAHFDQLNDYKYTNLATNVSKFFWQLKRLKDKEFEKYIAKNQNILTKYLDLLYTYARTSNRLDYFFKTMQILRKRLKNIDFKYNGHNLRYSYDIDFILENTKNKAVIDILQNKKYNQRDIKDYINNPILRDAVRYSAINKKSAYIIQEIKHNTKLLDNFKVNKTLPNNYLKLLKKELQTTKTKTQLKEENKLQYINAFKKALKIAKNEKELREILKEKYDFKFKKRKGKVIGFEFNSIYLNIKDLGFKDISEIRQVLMSNYAQHTENRSETLKINYKSEKNKRNLEKRREYYENRNYKAIRRLIETARENAERELRNKREIKINSSTEYTNTQRECLFKQTINRTARELNEISKRECRIERENSNIREQTQSFRKRITDIITNSITNIRNTIKSAITNFFEKIRRRVKNDSKSAIKKIVEENFDNLRWSLSEQFYRYCERNNPEYNDFNEFFKKWIVKEVLKGNINLNDYINTQTFKTGFKFKR